ncbi:gliding motility protein GldC [bacterium BMS3Abin03]|nr:gliding motility protein GldC [bacterium BMS3Abin03]MCG6958532.1 gliding motility protein GldC [bacterium BMS3Abin03]
MSKKSEIKITVVLDDKNNPEKIEWGATDAQFEGVKPAKTLLLSFWDEKENITLGIDLWTKEMTINDMNIHFYQVLLKLADTFERSTKNKNVADMIRKFGSDLAEKLELSVK